MALACRQRLESRIDVTRTTDIIVLSILGGICAAGLGATIARATAARIIPNLKAIGLLTNRIRPRYEKIDLLKYEKKLP